MMETILLLGCPNAGKTAIFNLLTGGNRKVANYSGITVDSGSAEIQLDDGKKYQLIDLPGIYTLHPTSVDEGVTVGTLLGANQKIPEFDKLVVVADSSRIECSLGLILGLKEIYGDQIVVVANKIDFLKNRVDWQEFEEKVGTKVLPFSTFKNKKKDLTEFLTQSLKKKETPKKKFLLGNADKKFIPFSLEGNKFYDDAKNNTEILKDIERIQKAARALRGEVVYQTDNEKLELTQKIDRVLLHPILGGLIFFGIFYFIFHSIYTWSGPLMDYIDVGTGLVSDTIGATLSDGLFKSFLIDGVIAGVGGVVIFLPQIMILFFLISLLEQSGYIARASLITDRMMAVFGLNGRAFLPYMSGLACSIPAIMATRTIEDQKERMATLMTIPFITCSARIPVYVLLVGTFVPEKTVLGIFNLQALVFFFLYFLGSITALVVAKIFRLSFFKGKANSFVIDLPMFQRPRFVTAMKSSWFKGKVFLKKAGTVILGLSMVIWVLSTFPRSTATSLQGLDEKAQAAYTLEHSYIGKIGKGIEPVIKPLGYDWKIGVGLLVAFGARELLVSAMGTIYALGDVDENSKSLRERLMAETHPVTGEKVFNLAVIFSLLVFFAYACQCISTLAIVKRETGGWKYPTIMFFYMGAMAYGGAFLTYQLFRAFA